jgi:hypothetical protein
MSLLEELEGLEAGLLGYALRCGQPTVAVYGFDECIRALVVTGMDDEAALEWMHHNIPGAWAGEHTPIVLMRSVEP